MDITADDNQTRELIVEKEFRYAGFWMRFWAYLIDVLIVFSVNGLLLTPLKLINEGMAIDLKFWTLNSILAGVVYYVYFALMTKYFQQTVGKMIMGLEVISSNKASLSWSDVFFREVVVRFIYNVFFVLKLLYLVMVFNKEKQGLHDMAGNTFVVHKSS